MRESGTSFHEASGISPPLKSSGKSLDSRYHSPGPGSAPNTVSENARSALTRNGSLLKLSLRVIPAMGARAMVGVMCTQGG